MSTTTANKIPVVIGNFGNGRLSPAMDELFRDVQRNLSFTPMQAHATALQAGIDAGPLLKMGAKVKFGKTNKDNTKLTLKEVTKGIKVNATWPLKIASITTQLDEVRRTGCKSWTIELEEGLMIQVNDHAERLESVTAERMTEILAEREAKAKANKA